MIRPLRHPRRPASRRPPPRSSILKRGHDYSTAPIETTARNRPQLDLAAKYLQAANTYRDQLQPDEQATLDAYLAELAKAKTILGSRASAPSLRVVSWR